MSDEIRHPRADLEKFKKNSMTRKRLAWELLKQTRNPVYVSLRYDFPVEDLEKALEKIPDDTGRPFKRSDSAARIYSGLRRAGEVLPPIAQSREPGEDDDIG